MALAMLLPVITYCQNTGAPASANNNSDTIHMVLIIIAAVLILPISVLGKSILLSAKMYVKQDSENSGITNTTKLLLPFIAIGLSYAAKAQDAAVTTVAKASSIDTATLILLCVIALEVLIILFLGLQTVRFIKGPVAEPEYLLQEAAAPKKSWLKERWEKMNNFKPIGEEADMDTGHDYDGIRELDNVTPGWFKAGFLLCILFGLSYLWRYHVSKSAPLQIEEYNIEMKTAALEQEEYLKTQKNRVDETTVTMLGADDIAAGKAIFISKCSPCHKEDGGGSVGPNLTDEYWIHGGAIGDIFKTIKYGWPEKGMISWKDQFSAVQIAQLASFIKSLKGTKPAAPKEPQGDVYKETSAVPVTDSITTISN